MNRKNMTGMTVPVASTVASSTSTSAGTDGMDVVAAGIIGDGLILTVRDAAVHVLSPPEPIKKSFRPPRCHMTVAFTAAVHGATDGRIMSVHRDPPSCGTEAATPGSKVI